MEILEINNILLSNYPGQLQTWLPGGQVINGEYTPLNPIRGDKNPGSFKINIDSGIWQEFASDDGGNDPISLFAYINGLTQGQAITRLRSELTGQTINTTPKIKKPKITKKNISSKTKPSNFDHYKHGKPSSAWVYKDAHGLNFGFIARFDLANGKEILPMTFNGTKWNWGGFGENRPLYKLDIISKTPNSETILIVEGEKTAEYASMKLKNVPVTTWQGGSKAINKTDWTPLKGKKVILFPDNDAPGITAINKISEILLNLDCNVSIVTPPSAEVQGWDLADATSWGREKILSFIKANLIQAKKPTEPENKPEPKILKKDHRKYEPIGQLEGMPFKLLGYSEQELYFLPFETLQIMSISTRTFSKNNLLSLAPIAYWQAAELHNGKSFQTEAAIDQVIRQCRNQGIYETDNVRGRGVWWDDGRAVLHLGNKLICEGEINGLHEFKTNYIYERARSTKIDLDAPMSQSEGFAILELCKSLSWENSLSAYYLAGWIFLSPICGALSWRPHIWLTGPKGSGKSWTLTHIIRTCLGNNSLFVQSETTEAGIRQKLKADALPIIFDEAETDEGRDADRMKKIMSLMRQSSSENENACILKGSGSGEASAYTIRSMWSFGSIAVGSKLTQDDTRISILRFRNSTGNNDSRAKFEITKALHTKAIKGNTVATLQARAINMIPVIRETVEVFINNAAEVIGSQRAGDQIGTLLAGAWCLTHNNTPTKQEAINFTSAFNFEEEMEINDTKEEIELLSYLLQQRIRVSVDEYTVGELILKAAFKSADPAHVSEPIASAVLKRHGFLVEGDDVFIGNKAAGVKALLKNTSWGAIKYHEILRRVKGAIPSKKTMYFAGAVMRATAIPIDRILNPEGL